MDDSHGVSVQEPALEQHERQVLQRHFHDIASPQPDELERLAKFLIEQEQREKELADANRHLTAYRDRYTELYDFAPLGYLTLDEDGYVQECNRTGDCLLGVEGGELIGFPLVNHVIEAHREELLKHIRSCIHEQREVTSEILLVTRSGAQIPVQIHSTPILVDDHQGMFCKSAITDITNLKQAQELFERERNLLRTLIDNLPDYIYVKDRQCRFVTANAAVARVMGVQSPDDLIGHTDHDFYSNEFADEYRRDEERVLQSGEPLISKDEPHRDAVGNLRAILTSKVALRDHQGAIIGLVGISRDITQLGYKTTQEGGEA